MPPTSEQILRQRRPVTRLLTAAVLGLLPTAAACGGPSVAVPADPAEALQLVEDLLTKGDAGTAVDVLDSLERDLLVEEQRAQFVVLQMRGLYAQEDYWDCFKVAQDFVDEHRFSPLAPQVEKLEFAAGKALLQDDDSSGEVVLEHFVARFDASDRAPEALKILGDAAFAARRFAIAEVRFSELLQSHPSSEWAEYARYRLAITAFRRVRGTAYDLDQMQLARNELVHYLALAPERPEFRIAAEEARDTLEVWLGQRHVDIADFYRTVGNAEGERLHLERAASEYAATEAGALARQRLATLGSGER